MFIDLLRSRRSVRKFERKPIEAEKVEILVEAALRSPSGSNKRPWEFVVVTDSQRLLQLSEAKKIGSSFIRNAPMAIVICVNPEKSDVWVEDASIAALVVHLAAADVGLGSCWVQIRLREHDADRSAQQYVAELLGLSEGTIVEAIVAVGYSAEHELGHPESSLLYDRVTFDKVSD